MPHACTRARGTTTAPCMHLWWAGSWPQLALLLTWHPHATLAHHLHGPGGTDASCLHIRCIRFALRNSWCVTGLGACSACSKPLVYSEVHPVHARIHFFCPGTVFLNLCFPMMIHPALSRYEQVRPSSNTTYYSHWYSPSFLHGPALWWGRALQRHLLIKYDFQSV